MIMFSFTSVVVVFMLLNDWLIINGWEAGVAPFIDSELDHLAGNNGDQGGTT